MHIQRISIKNFKAIKDLEKDLNCDHIILIGENGVGKSSFIQAILSCLGVKGHLPPKAVTDGEKDGEVTIWTEDGYTFHMDMKATNNAHKIVVTGPDGMKSTLKSAIANIVGSIDFDIFDFVEKSSSEKGKREQVEFVKSLLDEDTQAAIKRFEMNIKANYEGRTEAGREIKRLKGAIESSPITPDDAKKYKEPVDVKSMQAELEEISSKNKEIDAVKARMDDRQYEIRELEKKLLELQEKQKKAEEFLAANKKVDTTELSERISGASDHNVMVEKVRAYKELESQLAKAQSEWEDAEVLVNSQREELINTIKSLDFPVDGLTFTEESLIYNDREVDINTMSTSEIMQLGVMIHMAMNPNMKVITIPRGESLGAERLKAIVDMADEYGYQIIMEQVERGTKELKVEFLVEK